MISLQVQVLVCLKLLRLEQRDNVCNESHILIVKERETANGSFMYLHCHIIPHRHWEVMVDLVMLLLNDRECIIVSLILKGLPHFLLKVQVYLGFSAKQVHSL